MVAPVGEGDPITVLPGGTRRGKRLHGLQVSRERARVGQGVRGGCVEPGDVLEEAGRLEAGQAGRMETVVGPAGGR